MISRRRLTFFLSSSGLAQMPEAPPELDWRDAKTFNVEGLASRI
jgi:hypothetical protein